MTTHNRPLWVYLDQNKWIELARAYYSRPDGKRFSATLNQVQEAVKNDSARFPISADHITETAKAGNADRRKRLAQFMAKFSQTRTIAPQHAITPYEIDVSIAKIFHPDSPTAQYLVFGKGVQFAFGKDKNDEIPDSVSQELSSLLNIPELVTFYITMQGEVELPEHLQNQVQYAAMHTPYTVADIMNVVQHSQEFFAYILSSPDETERKLGTTNFTSYIHRILAEQKRVRDAGKQYDRDMRRRGFAARLADDPAIQTLLYSSLRKVGRSFDDFLALGGEQLIAFWESVPTLDVEAMLESERDEQWSRQIQANDVIDVSFLSVAIPYCDIVVTERLWIDLAQRNNLDRKYNTVLLNDLADLGKYLLSNT